MCAGVSQNLDDIIKCMKSKMSYCKSPAVTESGKIDTVRVRYICQENRFTSTVQRAAIKVASAPESEVQRVCGAFATCFRCGITNEGCAKACQEYCPTEHPEMLLEDCMKKFVSMCAPIKKIDPPPLQTPTKSEEEQGDTKKEEKKKGKKKTYKRSETKDKDGSDSEEKSARSETNDVKDDAQDDSSDKDADKNDNTSNGIRISRKPKKAESDSDSDDDDEDEEEEKDSCSASSLIKTGKPSSFCKKACEKCKAKKLSMEKCSTLNKKYSRCQFSGATMAGSIRVAAYAVLVAVALSFY